MNPDVFAEKAHVVLRRVFPDLHIDNILKLGEGWDSIALLVNDSMVFRIPKRPVTSRQLVKEIRALGAIRPYVSARIPHIEWVAEGDGHFPITAVGYRKLGGIPLFEIPQGPTKERALQKLGKFVRELHVIPTSVLAKAEVPWLRWTGDGNLTEPDSWEAGLRGFTKRVQDDVVPLLSRSIGHVVTDVISEFLSCPQHFQFEPTLIHGDLAPEHVLVDTEAGDIGVIDFGDCGLGDPAYDVLLDLAPFYKRSTDESFKTRQRFYRKMSLFHGALHGLMVGDERLVADTLQQVDNGFAAEKPL